jgi:predicted amidophosphoribosyltransferase
MDKWVVKCKSEGLCRQCGKPADDKPNGGKYMVCADCRRLNKAKRESLAAIGLCKGCGEPLNGDPHKYCEKCRAYARQFYWRRVYGV